MSETTDTAAKPRLLPLDLARGIAALVVAVYHFQELGWFKYPNASPPLAVPFFFMLSGFVLSYSYGELIRSGRMRLGDFVQARLARLYPLHLATLVVMGLLWLSIGTWPPAGAGPSYPLQAGLFTGLQLLEGLTLTPSSAASTASTHQRGASRSSSGAPSSFSACFCRSERDCAWRSWAWFLSRLSCRPPGSESYLGHLVPIPRERRCSQSAGPFTWRLHG